jgi:precorrin-6Y C5,15-methyltransferase (decarboxylating)
MSSTDSLVAVVGIGEDGVMGLRPDARAAVEDAQILVGGERHHQFFPKHSAERIIFRQDATRLAEEVAHLAEDGRRIVVLASGDPGFFGIGPYLARRLGPERVRIYPNLGCVPLAFARLGESWQDATVLSAHGRPLAPVVAMALGSAKLAILADDQHTPAVVAGALLAGGLEPEAKAWVMERLGGPAERIRHGSLGEVASWACDPLSMLIVLRDPRAVRGPALRLGLPDDAYAHERGQITKAEVRAVSLARLAPRAGDTVWDVGAGSGSVSVESAAFCQPGIVYAVERRSEQRACITENVARFGATNVRLVAGEAPECLANLPDPDAVFVGGTGGRLPAMLEAATRRLRPRGRLVLNLVTLEALHEATAFLTCWGLAHDVAQVSVARGAAIGGATRLAALNPVFVVSAQAGTA